MRKWIALYLIIALSISSCSAQDTGRFNSDLSLESSMELEQSYIPEISNSAEMLEDIQPTQDGISIPSNYDSENYIIPFDNPDMITVYTTYPYYFNLYMPVPKHTSGITSNEEFLRLTLNFNGEYKRFENTAIYVEKTTAIIRPPAELTLFESDKAYFNSMAKTLLKNINGLEKVIIEADVSQAYRPLDLEHLRNPLPEPFPIAEHTYEELAVLRSEIPFISPDYNMRRLGMLYPNVKDEIDLMLTNFLQSIGLSNQYSHYNQELSYISE